MSLGQSKLASWFKSRYLPPDPYADGTVLRLCAEIDSVPRPKDSSQVEFLLEQATELRQFERDKYDRLDRRGIALLTASVSIVTLIAAGVGTKAFSPIACVPSFFVALLAVVESAISLRAVRVGCPTPVTTAVKRAADGFDPKYGQLKDLHVESELYRMGAAIRTKHAKAVILLLAIAAGCFVIPIGWRVICEFTVFSLWLLGLAVR